MPNARSPLHPLESLAEILAPQYTPPRTAFRGCLEFEYPLPGGTNSAPPQTTQPTPSADRERVTRFSKPGHCKYRGPSPTPSCVRKTHANCKAKLRTHTHTSLRVCTHLRPNRAFTPSFQNQLIKSHELRQQFCCKTSTHKTHHHQLHQPFFLKTETST